MEKDDEPVDADRRSIIVIAALLGATGRMAVDPKKAAGVYQLRIYRLFERAKAAFHAHFAITRRTSLRGTPSMIVFIWEARGKAEFMERLASLTTYDECSRIKAQTAFRS